MSAVETLDHTSTKDSGISHTTFSKFDPPYSARFKIDYSMFAWMKGWKVLGKMHHLERSKSRVLQLSNSPTCIHNSPIHFVIAIANILNSIAGLNDFHSKYRVIGLYY